MAVFEEHYTKPGLTYTDSELVAACNAGQSIAFGVLMSRHGSSLKSRIRRFGVNEALAEDIEQETWIRAYQKLGDLRDGESFGAWLMQVADTTCLGYVRKDKRREAIAPVVDMDPEVVEAVADGVGDPVEDLATVTGILAEMPPGYSEVLMLKYLEHLSMEEIAAQTGLSQSGVKWRLRHAKQAFRKAVEEMSGHQTDEKAVEQLIQSAEAAAQASRWQEALETYETARRKADLDWNSLSTLGRIYERRGDFHRAIKLLEKALQLKPWPWLSVVLGWCYDGLGEREKAVAIYERVLLSGGAGPWAASTAMAGLKQPHGRRKSEPEPVKGERAIPRHGWSVKTNHNPDDAHLAIDGDVVTQWTSLAAQDHHMYFELDLGRVWNVTRVVYDDDGDGQCIWIANCPHGYVIDVSLDRVNWRQVAAGSADADKYAGAAMDGSPVRYIRIRITEQFFPNWLSIYEIRVYAR